MSDNKVKIFIYLFILAIFAGIAWIVLVFMNQPEEPNELHTPITNDYSFSEIYEIDEYQTIYNCVKNYYDIRNSNSSHLVDLLWETYKDKNNISVGNVNSFVEKKYESFNYIIENVQKYSNAYFSMYYVIGNYSMESLEESIEEIQVKDLVIQDVANNTYAILPVLNLNSSFQEIITMYQLDSYSKSIPSNDFNSIVNGTMSEFNEAMLYFSDFITRLNDQCFSAYSLIGDNSKSIYSNIESFQKVCSAYQTKYVSPTITSYKTSEENGEKHITITDNYSNRYIFNISSVKKYKVDISIK